MAEFGNGFEYLKKMQEKAGNKKPTLRRFQSFLDMKAREKGLPINGQFELTPLCNLDCKMCYVHLTKEQMEKQPLMTVAQWKELMYQAWKMGMFQVTLTGGECLTYPGFREIYLYLHSLGCEITVMTNGILLDEKWLAFFTEHRPSLIKLTLYGHNDDTYEQVTGQRCFEKVKDHIQQILRAGLRLAVSITPNRYLGDEVFETIRTAKELCPGVFVTNALFDPREETGRAGQKDEMDDEYYLRIFQLLNSLEGEETIPVPEEELPPAGGPLHETSECGLICGGGRSSFVVDWKGTMIPCNRFYDIKTYPLEEGFEAAWKKLNQFAESWPRVPECEGCAYSQTCILCAAHMRRYAEPGKQPVKMCERVRYLVKNGVWHIPECE